MDIRELFPSKQIRNSKTGLVEKTFMTEYVSYLTDCNIPYALGIMEIDNLLNIADTFGKNISEELLIQVCNSLNSEINNQGILGYYDESSIMIVFPNVDNCNKIYGIFSEIYAGKSLRHDYSVKNISYYITATSGSAVYPADASTLSELMIAVNKALYRGRQKGRNCFITYVHSKHKDIVLDNINKISYSKLMDDIALSFRLCSPMNTFLENTLRMIKEVLGITGAFFIDNESNMISSKSIGSNQLASLTIRNFESILKASDLINMSNLEAIYDDVLKKKLSDNKMNSFIIKNVIFGQKSFGYVGFYSELSNKVWSNEDISLLVHIEKLIGMSRTLENRSTMIETRKSLYVNKLGEVVDVYTLNSPLFEGLSQTAERRYMFSKNLLSNVVRWDKNAVEYFDLPDEYFFDSSGIWLSKIHPDDLDEYVKSRDAVINGISEYQNIDYRVLNKQGEYIVCTSKAVKIKNNEGYELLVGTVENHGIASRIDATTNLYSIGEFIELFKNYKAMEISPSVLYIGINNFTQINDLYGYTFGNKVLSTVSSYFQYIAKNSINVFKMDGVKFAFVFPNKEKLDIDEVYEKIKNHLKNYILVDKIKVNLSISGGAVYDTLDFDENSVQTSCKYALLQSKSLKTGKLIWFDNQLLNSNVKNVELINELRRSIAQGFKGFQIYYQPVVFVSNNQIYGAEALLRWKSENLGFVSPGIFMSWLETDPSFYDLGNWILEQSMKEGIRYLDKYPDFILNINIAYTQLSNPNFKSDLLDIISKTEYPVRNLCLEITERCRQLDRDFLCNEIEELRSMGIKIAIDDFGTGTATLNLLNDLSVDVIKIDRSFIIDILTSKKCQAIIQAITECARNLDVKVCCEGIEDKVVLDFISQYYINTYQGYYYSRPIPHSEFMDKFINK
ncbi:MAG: EAL domain-containing protein [Acholeplasmatales bacterium]|nr:EAL domain-containing protein [Acholeplasmatales bacterium]